MAAEVPTPAEHISARRMLQLTLLTKRNAATPFDTWGEDTAKVLAADFDAFAAQVPWYNLPLRACLFPGSRTLCPPAPYVGHAVVRRARDAPSRPLRGHA